MLCGSLSSSRSLVHWSMRMQEDKEENRVCTAVEITLVKQLNLILEYKEYIGLGRLETNP